MAWIQKLKNYFKIQYSKIDKEYARVDIPSAPGYFSFKVESDKYSVDNKNRSILINNNDVKDIIVHF